MLRKQQKAGPCHTGRHLMDALTIIGIFMLGAGAGSLLTYVHHRALLARYRKLAEDLAALVPENTQTNATAGG